MMRARFFHASSTFIGILCIIKCFNNCYAWSQLKFKYQQSNVKQNRKSLLASQSVSVGVDFERRVTNFSLTSSRQASMLIIKATTSGEAVNSTENLNPTSPKLLVARGMEAFREGDINESIKFFNAAEKQTDGRLTPFLWQRGISYYYADKFLEGSVQFRNDVAVNPLDVEEIVWDIACQNRLSNICGEMPLAKMMSLPKGKKDRRRIMSAVYSLFREEATEEDLARAGHEGNVADEFYSLFYLGLYCESKCESSKAESYMKAAISSEYATVAGKADYMTAVADTHCRLRHWK